MNEHIKAAIVEARKAGKIFFYSASVYPGHKAIEICVECDAILVPEQLREEL